MTVAEARKHFPYAIRVERSTWNGIPCWKIVCSVGGHETWHYVEVERV